MFRIALIGFMASGKSTVGRELAARLHCRFVDTDTELARRYKEAPGEILRNLGEKKFRIAEFEVLSAIVKNSGSIVCATGGGIVTHEPNAKLITSHFYTVWLRIRLETIRLRLRKDPTDRPLLAGQDDSRVEALLARRIPIYKKTADFIIDVDELQPAQVADRIVESDSFRSYFPDWQGM